MFKEASCSYVFAHLFLKWTWILMARADLDLLSHVGHISWASDCLVLYLIYSKTDQKGVNRNEPWHVYANPFSPEIFGCWTTQGFKISDPIETIKFHCKYMQ